MANKDLVSRVTHELHTPLTRITLATGLIARKTKTAELNPQLESIEQDCRQMVDLSNELMDLSRLATGRIEANKESIVLGPFVTQETENFQNLFQERNILIKN